MNKIAWFILGLVIVICASIWLWVSPRVESSEKSQFEQTNRTLSSKEVNPPSRGTKSNSARASHDSSNRIRMEESAFGINACEISEAAARTYGLNKSQVQEAEVKLKEFHDRLLAFAVKNITKKPTQEGDDPDKDAYSLLYDSEFAYQMKSELTDCMADIGGGDFAEEITDQITNSSKFLRLGQYNMNFIVENSINQRTGKKTFTVTVSFRDPASGEFCGATQAPLSAFNANYMKLFE